MLTVIDPPVSSNLTTLAAIKEELGVDTGEHDAVLGEMIVRASAQVRTICDRDFGLARVRQTIHCAQPGGLIFLQRYPVTEVHSVTINGLVLNDDEYGESHGQLYLTSGRWGHYGSLIVDYSAGYVLPGEEGATLPADVERATIQLIRDDYFYRQRDPSLRSEAVDGLTTLTYFQAPTPAAIMPMLERYRMPVAL